MVTRRLCFVIIACSIGLLFGRPPCVADAPASQQLVNISGLPGGGIVVDQQGRASREGAVQINIPVAFTPSWGFVAVGAWKGGFAPPFRDRANPGISPSRDFENGSGLLAAGFGPPSKGIYLGLMFLSSALDKVHNIQWEPYSNPRLQLGAAIGVQDVLGRERRSVYLVGTKVISLRKYSPTVSLGYGTGRFDHHIFGGFSVPLVPGVHGMLEHDGFQWNGGFVIQPWKGKVVPNILVAFNGLKRPLLGVAVAGQFK